MHLALKPSKCSSMGEEIKNSCNKTILPYYFHYSKSHHYQRFYHCRRTEIIFSPLCITPSLPTFFNIFLKISRFWISKYFLDHIQLRGSLKSIHNHKDMNSLPFVHHQHCIKPQRTYRYWKETINLFCSLIVGTRNH